MLKKYYNSLIRFLTSKVLNNSPQYTPILLMTKAGVNAAHKYPPSSALGVVNTLNSASRSEESGEAFIFLVLM